ncbi:MAG TPA: hypothetical protein VFH80_11920 [Solirubrobacteraceae bacterium]|nr:hypothetical protein [Solirubrobacteraceae bacterium]
MDVDAGVGAGEPALGTGQLDPCQDLLSRFVTAQLGLCGCSPGRLGELVDPGLELGEGALERVEAQPFDASSGPDRERPGGYLRWSIGA